MRGFIEGTIVILTAAMLMAAIPTEAEAQIYEDTVRLHILAHSDAKEDQEVKIYVRDTLLSVYGEALSCHGDAAAASETMETLLPEIERSVCDWLEARGFGYGARVTLSEEWYERRVYADATYPEGRYASLRVILGDGEGKNWWCVMFPPLCLDMALGEEIPYSAEEKALIGGKYRMKLKALELAARAFK